MIRRLFRELARRVLELDLTKGDRRYRERRH